VDGTLQRLWQRLHAELAAFGVVGGICLATDLVLFNVFAFKLGITPVLAKAIDMVITGVMAFFGHRFITFRHRDGGGIRREVPVFVAVTLASVALGLLPLVIVRHGLGLTSVLALNVANLLGIALGTAARYVSYRGVVWKHDPQTSAGSVVQLPIVDSTRSHQVTRGRLLEMQDELVGE
jgi:putative flippase GtrA